MLQIINQVEHEWAINISKNKTVFLTNEKLSEKKNCYMSKYNELLLFGNLLLQQYFANYENMFEWIFYNPIYTGLKELH